MNQKTYHNIVDLKLSLPIKSLVFQLRVNWYHYCSSTKMDLALDNQQKLTFHLAKKPNRKYSDLQHVSHKFDK